MCLIGRVGRMPSMFHGGGDGERIVAFGRVGKPLENPFFRPFRISIDAPETMAATDFKAAWR